MQATQQSQYRSMYLSTIPNKKKQHNQNNTSLSLITVDILGARSRYLEKPIKPRQTFYNKNDDIEKSRSKRLVPEHSSKKDRQLEVDDISGTRTKINKFTTTRQTDPLNPSYQLPTVILADMPEPKFIRDNMQIDDIEGTRTKQTFIRLIEQKGKVLEKEPMLFQLKAKKLKPKINNFLLDVADINQKQRDQIKARDTNPLEPEYKLYPTQENRPQSRYGAIQGNKSANPKANIKSPDFCLGIQDIVGAAPKKGRQVSSSKAMEVTGSKPNSLKRGLSTKRQTNPLQPSYNYLGNKQMKVAYSRPKTAAQKLDQFLQ